MIDIMQNVVLDYCLPKAIPKTKKWVYQFIFFSWSKYTIIGSDDQWEGFE